MATSAEYKLGQYAYPRGWFAVANASDVTRSPYNAHYFGQDVVLFRGESGKVVMLSAYCPHMGTHLGKSRNSHVVTSGMLLEGDCIRCPFHGWRFGPDGRCNEIPYFDGPIPAAARVQSWPTEERYGIVFCWNDPEAQAPDFGLPEMPEWDDPSYVRWEGLIHLADLPCHPIEIFDNNSDYAHLIYTHGGAIRSYENEVDGNYYWQRESMVGAQDGEGEHMGRGIPLSTINRYHGPGLNNARFLEARGVQLIAATPIDDGSTRLWQCAMLGRPPGASDEGAREAWRLFNNSMVKGLGYDDGEIWANKRAAINVMQLPTDGPFWQARLWYSQFFNPRAMADSILKRVQGIHHVRGVAPFAQPDTRVRLHS
ncbi:MAG TPA: Rieske 2Fe-2S domain-containing protein [Steroidobacteraceae bacterium]|jgi:3-ketosteroid 9alpha-monooxygenase subunit A|nr:Rieske 2Fe-2S domain-containing protein [Steroidobacteraceae bacterium]